VEKKKVEINFVGGHTVTFIPDDVREFITAITIGNNDWVTIEKITLNKNNIAFFQVLD
jgi:hypothetical protein